MQTKKCSTCHEFKSLNEFNKNKAKKDGLSSHCRKCSKKYNKYHYSINKQYYIKKAKITKEKTVEWFAKYKQTLKCEKCGNSHPATLDFHHTNPNEKEVAVAKAIRLGWSKKRILSEIEKCKILCSNCHRILHWEERQE